ncbi:hypothetical protein HMPREF1981_01326 [Bacteroides pyogenes F0041]|uniref:Uncharacterized protein n=1 Tax=Bacteroides pyogenes F0041 TaxID=1321819 RepID=U2DVZ3_9BACE|nr:hypothetical protein HMPREF1981_01326 [Bacteroides pyogenes F0041]
MDPYLDFLLFMLLLFSKNFAILASLLEKRRKGNIFMSDWHIPYGSLFILNDYLCRLKQKTVNSKIANR